MSEDLNRPFDEDIKNPAGGNPLERSESGFSPASRGGEGVPNPEADPDTAEFWGDTEGEDWEDPEGPQLPKREGNPADWEPEPVKPPNLIARKRGKSLAKRPEKPRLPLTPQQKLLLLDTWQRSGLPARDFGALINMSRHTLYAWKRRFEQEGPAGLMDKPRRKPGRSQLSEITKRAILMLKQAHPDWGCERISDTLARGPALGASATTVARVLREEGYEMEEQPTRRHPDKVRHFERARPNQLWQTDLFTFMLKRQNRRVHLVAFMDDHSRFITGYGLHATQSSALVIEVLRSAIASYGAPQEILTDNGAQYITWRGKGKFTKELEKRGIKQIVARPRRPQTLGKIERFWGTLWRECVESAVFLDLADARQRIGLYIDYYNLGRTHSGIDRLYPADRYFEAAPEVLKTMKERLAANALELARNGVPKKPFYLTGQLDGKPFSVHQEGDKVVLRKAGEEREEIDLAKPPQDEQEPAESKEELPPPIAPDGSPQTAWRPPDAEPAPGVSAIDDLLKPESNGAQEGESHDG